MASVFFLLPLPPALPVEALRAEDLYPLVASASGAALMSLYRVCLIGRKKARLRTTECFDSYSYE